MDNFEERLCEAHCCVVKFAEQYVIDMSKGRASEQDFYTLILLDQYLDALDRYENSLSLNDSNECCCCHHHQGSCLTEEQAQFILGQIITVCGACSCNC